MVVGVFGAYQISSATSNQLAELGPGEVEFWKIQIESKGGFEAYKLFGEMNKEKPNNTVHDLAHVFGEALYRVEGIDGVAVCDSQYAFGCYHSFFGWALIDNGIDIITELDEACIAVHGEKGLGCQHGIGHGVLAELGPAKLAESLTACSTLNWQGPVGGCTSGVFMEYNLSTMGTTKVRSYDPEAPYYPCTDVADKYKQACYFEMSPWWLQTKGTDYQAVGELCAGLTDVLHREMCYRGTGNIAVGFSAYNIDYVISSCSQMPNPEGVALCTEGAVWIIASQKEFGDIWKPLCEALEGNYREECLLDQSFI